LQMTSKTQRVKARQPEDEDDEFEYGDAATHDRHADLSDYSVHQFLAADSARGVKGAGDDVQEDGDDDDGSDPAEEQDDNDFNSEDTPEDSFLQMKSKTQQGKARQPEDEDDEFEYGDAATHDRHADLSDYSVHQFLAADSARGVKGAGDDVSEDGDDDDGSDPAEEQDDNDFNSEDTPEDS